MEALKQLTAIAVPIEGANIDTDRLIPARLMRNPRDKTRTYAQSLFHDLRFTDDGSEIGDFILNQSAYRAAKILVSGRNFGCGSSRESAVYALLDYGFRCVIAPSFGDIFYSNCVRNGIAPLRISDDEATALRSSLMAASDPTVTVNIENLTITGPDGKTYNADLPPFQQTRLLEGLDEIEATLKLSPKIDSFESTYFESHPWLTKPANVGSP